MDDCKYEFLVPTIALGSWSHQRCKSFGKGKILSAIYGKHVFNNYMISRASLFFYDYPSCDAPSTSDLLSNFKLGGMRKKKPHINSD
jgi:hypothetical protein